MAIGAFLGALSGSVVNVALPDLGRDLDLPLGASRWVLQAYLLAVAVALPFAGPAGDRFGHRQVYLAGFVLFAIASFICGGARGLEPLVFGRLLQGIGGAMVMATGPALMTTSFPGTHRGRVLGLLSTATYLGLTLGPTAGGLLVAAGGWRWVFWFNVPIVLLVLAPGVRLLPSGSGVARVRRALFDAGLFASPVFTGAALSALANYIALFIMTLLLPFYLLEGQGRPAAEAGLLLSAQPLIMALVAAPAGWLSDRAGTRALAVAGLVLQAAGLFGLSRLGPGSSFVAIGGWLALIGLGTGIFISPNSSALMGAAPRERQGVAGSLLAEARILGMLAGVLIGTTIFQQAGGRTGRPWGAQEYAALSAAVRAAVWVALAGAAIAALRGRGGRSPRLLASGQRSV